MEGIGDGIEFLIKSLLAVIAVLVAVLVLVLSGAHAEDLWPVVAAIAGWETGKFLYRRVFG